MNGPSVTRRFYRAYHLSQAGRIVRAEILEAMDDADALAKLRNRLDDHVVELWDRSHFLGRVEAARPSSVESAGRGADARLAGGQASRMTADLFKPLFANAEPDDAGRN